MHGCDEEVECQTPVCQVGEIGERLACQIVALVGAIPADDEEGRGEGVYGLSKGQFVFAAW